MQNRFGYMIHPLTMVTIGILLPGLIRHNQAGPTKPGMSSKRDTIPFSLIIQQEDTLVNVYIPHQYKDDKIIGSLKLISISDRTKVKIFPITTDDFGMVTIPMADLKTGEYSLKATWTCSKKIYSNESMILLK